MARKDVSLVINARDNASKALDRINASIEEFSANQTDVSVQAGKTSAALGKIAGAVEAVEKAFDSLDGATKLREQLDAAGQAVEKLRIEATAGSTAVKELDKSLKAAERAVTKYESQITKSAAALVKQRDALKASEVAVKASTKAQQAAADAQAKLQARQAALPAVIAKQEAALVKVQGRYSELSAKMQQVAAVSPALQAQFDSSSRNLQKNQTVLEALKAEYNGLGGAIKKSTKELASAGGSLSRANGNVDKATAKVQKLSQAHASLVETARLARVEASGLGKALVQSAQGATTAAAGLQQAETALVELQAKSQATEAALKELSTLAFDKLGDQLVQQGLAFRDSQRDVAALTQEVREYQSVIGQAGVPTREMAQNLAKLQQAASEAELKMMRQEDALRRMGQAYRDNGSSIEGSARSLAVFGAEQDRLSRDLRELTDDGYKARRAIDALNAAAAKSSTDRMASDIRRLGSEADRATPKISNLRKAYDSLYGGSRQSLSVTQRLRGEVLSMIAAYGGLYGVVNLLRQTVNAMQTLEGATARLNVANSGDFFQTGEDMEFLQRQANRLGIELGTLATEYSRFAIATQGTNLQGERTRRIFLSVAEAARVARISNAQMAGIFNALTQIVSKGTVQMEELKQQLGDRLPGALQIMADGLGITTAELIKMTSQNQITSDALLPFADELRRRFGPGLQDALTNTTAELGRLQNAAFMAMVEFGNAGFLEAFTDMVRDLTELLRSSEFASFAARLSQVFAVLADTAALVARNFQLVATVIGAAIGLKAVPVVLALARAVMSARASLIATALAARAATGGLAAAGGAALTTAGAFGVLRAAAIALLSSTGLGLLLVVGGALFANWLTSATAVNAAMEAHANVVDRVQTAYEEAEGSAEAFGRSAALPTVTQAREALRLLQEAVADTAAEMDQVIGDAGRSDWLRVFGNLFLQSPASREYRDEIATLTEEFGRGEINVTEYRIALDSLAEKYNDGSEANRRFALELDVASAALVLQFGKLEEAELNLIALTGSTEEVTAALAELANRGEESGRALNPMITAADEAGDALESAADNVDQLTDSVRGMLRTLPGFTDILDEISDSEAFAEMSSDAVEAALKVLDVETAWSDLLTVIRSFSFVGIFSALSSELISVRGLIDEVTTAFAGLFSFADRIGDLGGILSDAVGGLGGLVNGIADTVANGVLDGASDGVEAAFNLIVDKEGLRLEAYYDENHFRVGFGSDTFVDPTGAVRTTTSSTVITEQQAVADAMRRIVEYQDDLRQAVGIRFDTFDAAQQAALTSIAYNYGTLPSRVADVINSGGSVAQIAEAIRGLQGDGPFNDDGSPVNFSRRNQEALIFATGSTPSNDPIREEAEARLAANAATQEAIDLQTTELILQGMIANGDARGAARMEARLDAQRQNQFITEEQLGTIEALAAAQFDLELAQESANDADRISQEAAAQRAATQATLDDTEFAIRQQDLVNQGLERQALIEAAIRDAKAADPGITQAEIDLLTAQTSALYSAQAAGQAVNVELEAAEDAQERVNDLTRLQVALQDQLEATIASGNTEGTGAILTELESVNVQLLEAITNAEAMWAAVGGTVAQTAIAQLATARVEVQGLAESADTTYLQWDRVAGLFTDGLASAFDRFAEAVANGENAATAAKDAFLEFAGKFLIQIAQMILRQAIFNALSGAFGGTAFGNAIGIPVPTGHTGGMVGSKRVGGGNRVKTVNPGVFMGAQRYHGGGMIGGLAPGEIPIIAREGEYMASENDPLHPDNQTSRRAPVGGGDTKIVNMFDAASFLSEALNTQVGQRVVLNFVRANPAAFRSALGT